MTEQETVSFHNDNDINVVYYLLSLTDPGASNEELANSPIALAALQYCGDDPVKIVVFVRIAIEIMFYANVIKLDYNIDTILFYMNLFEEWKAQQETEIIYYGQCHPFIIDCLSRIHFDDTVKRYKGAFPYQMQVRNNNYDDFQKQIQESQIALNSIDITSLTASWIIMCKMLLEREMITVEDLGERAAFLKYSEDEKSVKQLVFNWDMKNHKEHKEISPGWTYLPNNWNLFKYLYQEEGFYNILKLMYEFEHNDEIFGLLQQISIIVPEIDIRIAELAISFDNVEEPISLLKEITAQKIADEGGYNLEDVKKNLDVLRNMAKEFRKNNIESVKFIDSGYFSRQENLAIAILEKRYIYDYDTILIITRDHEPILITWVNEFFNRTNLNPTNEMKFNLLMDLEKISTERYDGIENFVERLIHDYNQCAENIGPLLLNQENDLELYMIIDNLRMKNFDDFDKIEQDLLNGYEKLKEIKEKTIRIGLWFNPNCDEGEAFQRFQNLLTNKDLTFEEIIEYLDYRLYVIDKIDEYSNNVNHLEQEDKIDAFDRAFLIPEQLETKYNKKDYSSIVNVDKYCEIVLVEKAALKELNSDEYCQKLINKAIEEENNIAKNLYDIIEKYNNDNVINIEISGDEMDNIIQMIRLSNDPDTIYQKFEESCNITRAEVQDEDQNEDQYKAQKEAMINQEVEEFKTISQQKLGEVINNIYTIKGEIQNRKESLNQQKAEQTVSPEQKLQSAMEKVYTLPEEIGKYNPDNVQLEKAEELEDNEKATIMVNDKKIIIKQKIENLKKQENGSIKINFNQKRKFDNGNKLSNKTRTNVVFNVAKFNSAVSKENAKKAQIEHEETKARFEQDFKKRKENGFQPQLTPPPQNNIESIDNPLNKRNKEFDTIKQNLINYINGRGEVDNSVLNDNANYILNYSKYQGNNIQDAYNSVYKDIDDYIYQQQNNPQGKSFLQMIDENNDISINFYVLGVFVVI